LGILTPAACGTRGFAVGFLSVATSRLAHFNSPTSVCASSSVVVRYTFVMVAVTRFDGASTAFYYADVRKSFFFCRRPADIQRQSDGLWFAAGWRAGRVERGFALTAWPAVSLPLRLRFRAALLYLVGGFGLHRAWLRTSIYYAIPDVYLLRVLVPSARSSCVVPALPSAF
jgi:hypothetical protein